MHSSADNSCVYRRNFVVRANSQLMMSGRGDALLLTKLRIAAVYLPSGIYACLSTQAHTDRAHDSSHSGPLSNKCNSLKVKITISFVLQRAILGSRKCLSTITVCFVSWASPLQENGHRIVRLSLQMQFVSACCCN